jgi:hypothetical protein
MSSQYKYTRKELEKAVETKSTAKKFTNLTKKDNEFFIGDKKVIPAEEHPEFLRTFYDNPETGFQGRDQMFAKIAQDYVGISRRDIAKFLSLPRLPLPLPLMHFVSLSLGETVQYKTHLGSSDFDSWCTRISHIYIPNICPMCSDNSTAASPKLLFPCSNIYLDTVTVQALLGVPAQLQLHEETT